MSANQHPDGNGRSTAVEVWRIGSPGDYEYTDGGSTGFESEAFEPGVWRPQAEDARQGHRRCIICRRAYQKQRARTLADALTQEAGS